MFSSQKSQIRFVCELTLSDSECPFKYYTSKRAYDSIILMKIPLFHVAKAARLSLHGMVKGQTLLGFMRHPCLTIRALWCVDSRPKSCGSEAVSVEVEIRNCRYVSNFKVNTEGLNNNRT